MNRSTSMKASIGKFQTLAPLRPAFPQGACQHCGKPAVNSATCPYQEDVHNDPTLVHFWCDNPACAAEVKFLRYLAGMEI